MKVGIVGLPNAGKSSLFNALTRAGAEAANYPFTTIDPNVAIVPVRDERLEQVAALLGSSEVVFDTITFHDIGSFHEVLQVFLELESQTPTDKPITFRPKAGFRFNADIDFDQMRTIHTFPVDRGPGLPPVPASSDLVARWLRPLRGFLGPASP